MTDTDAALDRGLGRRFLTLGGGEALARLIGFTATIIAARRLGTSGYGVVAFAAAVVLYGNCLVDFAIETLGIHDIARAPESLARIVGPILTARLAIAAAFVLVVGGGGFLLVPAPDATVLAVACLTLLPDALSTRWVHLGIERPAPVAAARTIAAVTLVLLVVLLVRDAGDAASVPLAQLIGESLAALFLVALLHKAGHRLTVTGGIAVVRSTFVRAWPLTAHSLLGLLVFNADFLFLRALRGPASVGLYAAAYALISFLLNIGVAYGMSLLPGFTRAAGDAAAARRSALAATRTSLAVTLPAAVAVTLVARVIIGVVFGASYLPAAAALAILVWCVPAALIRTVAQASLIAAGRQHDVLMTVVWAASLNLILNSALIPPYGMLGAAAATVATELVRAAIAWRYARRLLPA